MKFKLLLCFIVLLTYYRGEAQTRAKGVRLSLNISRTGARDHLRGFQQKNMLFYDT